MLLVLAADHVVKDTAGFVAACRTAQPAADRRADRHLRRSADQPTTEYGYIRPGAPLDNECLVLDKFVEKPDRRTAQRYVADGYLWNSGNFMFRADVLLAEYRAFQPDSAAAIEESVAKSTTDLGFVLLDSAAFGRAKAISVDYAIMEKTAHAAVLPVSFDWSDVGSWQAVWQLAAKDAADNAVHGKAMFLDAQRLLRVVGESAGDGARRRQPDRGRERGRGPGREPRPHRGPAAAGGRSSSRSRRT